MSGPSQFDVAVIGAGPAGIAAAICAAEAGARTILMERGERIGGNASNAFVHTICGLYHGINASVTPESDPPLARYANPGFASRFAEAMLRAGKALPPEQVGRVFVLPISPTGFGHLAEALCGATASLTIRTRLTLTRLEFAGDCAQIEIAGNGSSEALEAAIVLDTTGDAAAATLAGAETIAATPDQLQLPSYIVRLEDVSRDQLHGFSRLHVTRAISRAAQQGRLETGTESVLLRPGVSAGDAYLTLNLPRPSASNYRPLDPDYLRELERIAHRRAKSVVAFLRAERPGFQEARVAEWPLRIGVRETRRVVGVAHLTRSDILSGQRRDDEIAISTWPVELWQDHRGATFEYPESPASIPLPALVSRTQQRLGTAGRCLSATHGALGALRVIGTAFATGEAIGTAAAIAADTGVSLAAVSPAAVRRHIATHSTEVEGAG